MLTLRGVLLERDGELAVAPDERALLRYYANSIAHLARPVPAPTSAVAAPEPSRLVSG